MKKKILTLTLLSTLIAIHPQCVDAAEQISPADRFKALAAARRNPQPQQVGLPLPALVQVQVQQPQQPQLGGGAQVVPQGGPLIPLVQPGLPLGQVPLAPNHEAEYLALLRQIMPEAYTHLAPTSADVLNRFRQPLMGIAGADIFSQVVTLRTQRNDAQRDMHNALLRVQELDRNRLEAILGHAPDAGEVRVDDQLRLQVGHDPLPADYANVRLVALFGGRVPTIQEIAYTAAHLQDADNVLTPALANIRLTPLLGGRVPSAAETAYGAAHIDLADLALTAGAVDARLTALFGGRAPTAQETAYAAGHLADNDVALTAGVVNARLTHLIGGGRVPTPEEIAYARANLADLDPALTDGIATARLTQLLGRVPNAAEVAYAGAHLGDADLVLLPALDNARLVGLIGAGRAPSPAELLYAGAHRDDTDVALTNGIVTDRLTPLLGGRVPTAEEIAYGVGHLADNDVALTAGAVDARLTALFGGRAPTAQETAYAAGNLADNDVALTAGVVHARLTHLIGAGRLPTAEETAYATANLGDLDPALTDGIATARLTALLGRVPSAAEIAHAGAHLGDLDAVLVPAVVDVRLAALLGRAPYAQETAYGILPASIVLNDVDLIEGATRARLAHLLHKPANQLTPEQVNYAINHPLDADDALLTGTETARLAAELADAGVGGVPSVQQVAEAVRLGHNANVDEIQEGLDLWNGGAGFRANYDEVGASIHLKGAVDQANADALAAHVGHVPFVPVVINPSQAELQECARLVNEPGLLDHHADLLNYENVQEALRIKNLPAVGTPNPFAGGLNATQFAEAMRLKEFPDYPVAGITARQLTEALRLKSDYPEIRAQLARGGGATIAQVDASISLQRQINANQQQWTAEHGVRNAPEAGPLFVQPTIRHINAAVHLRTKQGAGNAKPTPGVAHVLAVAKEGLTEPMQAALAKAIQNPIPNVGNGHIPYGIAMVTNAPGGYFELTFVKVTDGQVAPNVEANLFNTGLGFGVAVGDQPLNGCRIDAAHLLGAADGDIFAFTDMVQDALQVRLANPVKMN